MGAGEKRDRLRTRTGLLTSGNSSYYMGPIARWFSGVTGVMWVCIWVGLPRWVIELSGAGAKAAPFENENWVSNVWEFQLLDGAHRPLGFGRYRRVVGIYLGGSVAMG